MNLEIIKRIDVDFYNNKLVHVNAKQNDTSRFIMITCYNQGQRVSLDNMTNTAYIRGRKPDDNGFLNPCLITENGEVLAEMTNQMLLVPGNVFVDILIYNSSETIVSTMNFCINVVATPLDNLEVESSSEYNALNELMISAKREYDYVIQECKDSVTSAYLAKSYAVGGTGIRDGEDTDNAQYYYERSKLNAYIDLEIAKTDEMKNYLGIR